ncbi:hypothetical protein ACE6H2_005650 [Prunus campanulata]
MAEGEEAQENIYNKKVDFNRVIEEGWVFRDALKERHYRQNVEANMDLTPKQAQKLFEGDGGAYYIWSSSDVPALGEAKVGASKVVLQPHGFGFPHYADSAKLGYVLQGDDGLVGMVFPNTSEEEVIKLKKGDVIPIPLGSVSWWFNNGGSNSEELVVVFLGETTRAYIPGQFTYFFVAGTLSLLGGFSTEFVSKAYSITKDEADKITKSQTGDLIIKLGEDEKTKMPKPSLSASLTKLEANAISSPIYTTDATVQVVYVAGGSGQIQIVGFNGQLVLDTEVAAGDLLVVPSFFMVAKLAGGNGLECFSACARRLSWQDISIGGIITRDATDSP